MTTRSNNPRTIVIVGGGAAGALTAANLLRGSCTAGLRVVLVERRNEVGRGVAYSTTASVHRLNVRAERMSAYPEHPQHFFEWARARQPATQPHDYLPRFLYGDYLGETLGAAEGASPPGTRLQRITGEVVAVMPPADGIPGLVELDGDRRIPADHVVLATGNPPPANLPNIGPSLLSDDRYVADPWEQGALQRAGRGDSVLLIGSGLTMVDVALTLRSAWGKPVLRAVSRHGLLPRDHRPGPVAPERPLELPRPISLAALRAAIRTEVEAAGRRGEDWRSVMESLRPLVQPLWQQLPAADQRTFLARYARIWEVHRHRMAPEVSAAVRDMRARGRLTIQAGRLAHFIARPEGIDVKICPPAGECQKPRLIRVDSVVNCTGPPADLAEPGDRLFAHLLASGQIRAHELRLGIDTAGDGAVITASGEPSTHLSTLGTLRRGELWESVAIPEIRVQASELAARLLRELGASQASLAGADAVAAA